jgi:hypothetical protein
MFSRQGEAGKHAFPFMFYPHLVKTPTIEGGEVNANMAPLLSPSTY